MSIKFSPNAPVDTVNKMGSWAEKLKHELSAPDQNQTLSVSDGYEVHYLSLKEIVAGRLVDNPDCSRWRHMVSVGDQLVAEVELDESQSPIALHMGPGKDGLSTTVSLASSLDGDYEASVLSVAPLKFIALWLKGDNDDLIIPYAPNATSLKNGVAVPVRDVLDVLKPLAQDVINSTTNDTGG